MRVLWNDDGTEATVSQMAKDVSTFLTWAASPEMNERKKTAIRVIFLLGFLAIPTFYSKRHIWSVLKSRRVVVNGKKAV